MIRWIGYVFLGLGLAGVIYQFFLTTYDHTLWMYYSKQLPESNNLTREDAVNSLRDLQLALRAHHRMILIPIGFLFFGGVVLSIRTKVAGKSSDTGRGEK